MPRTLAIIAVLLSACSSPPPKGSSSSAGDGSASTISGGTNANGSGTSSGSSVGTGSSSGGTSSGGSATGGNGTGPDIGTYVKQYSTALCEYNFGCLSDANYYFTLCMSYAAPGYNDLPAAVDAGRIGYSAAKGQACLNSFNQAPCFGTPPSEQTACQETFRGLVVLGQPCYSTADCSGGFCASSDGCAGTCTAWAEATDACSPALPCNPTEYLSCIDGTCATPREVDERCGPTLPGCDLGLACVAGSCKNLPIPLTGTCVFGQGQCASGSYCFQKAGAPTGKCLATVQSGDFCAEDADHLKNAFSYRDFECFDPVQVTQCEGAGTLLDGGVAEGVCRTTAGEGNTCPDVPPEIDLSKPFGSGCFNGLDCAGPPLGATCDRTNPAGRGCYSLPNPCDPTKAFCDFDSGMCEAGFKTGAACTSPDQCGVFNTCTDAGICELPSGPVCSPAF